jgi:fibronectin-binding autotransporter adhesin
VNRIYRIVFNRSLGLRQVVSELARSRGKGGTKIRRLALSISAALAAFNQSASVTVPASAARRPESPRRHFAQVAGLVLPAAMSLGVMLPVTAHADVPQPPFELPNSAGAYLGAYVFNGPFDVGATITISSSGQSAITGADYPMPLILTNNGTIKAVGTANSGVAGISFTNGGTITNNAGGVIASDLYGIFMTGGTNQSITNSGTISATINTAGVSGRGIGLQGGGTITNNGTGSISGSYAGIIAKYGTTNVTNSGTINGGSTGISFYRAVGSITNSGSITGGDSGIYMQAGGTLTNQLGGSITGGSAGVLTKTGALDITNNGNIVATSVGGIGVDLHGGGSVTNDTTLTISGLLSGIRGSGAAVDVNNTGLGFIRGTDAIHGTGVDLEAGGSVTNDRYSRIFGTYAGVLGGSAAPVTITNDGTISSGGTIVNLASDAAIHLLGGGSIANDATGSLLGISYGVLMGTAASVTNDGTITAYNGVGVYSRADGTVINHAGGVITGYIAGVRLTGSGSVTNAGVIQAGGTAVNSAAVHLLGGGSIANEATGSLSSVIYGVLMDTAASVTNDGTITGNRGVGVFSRGGGTVTNHVGGAIYGYTTGVWLASAGSVTNAGIIRATGTPVNTVPVTAIHLLGGGSIANDATGSLFGDDYGVLMDVNATVTNDGNIRAGRGVGVGSSEGGTVINHAGGVITGNRTGVRLASSGSVTNAGTISGSYNSVVLSGDNSLLTLQTGSSLVGTALASGTGSQLQFDGNGSSSNGFSGFGTVSTTAGTQWTVSGNVAATGNLGVSTDTGSQLTLSGNVASQGFTKQGDGTLVIDGMATNSGNAEVMAGRLIVGSDIAHAGAVMQGDVQVDSGATIGGHGELSGNLNVLGGGHLAPGNSIGTLTVDGNLTLAQSSQIDFGFGAPGANFSQGVSDSVAVHGNLSLNGAALNITDAGGMGPGLYNLFTYDGTLTETNGGIVLDSAPGGGYAIQNLTTSKQINLIDTAGLTLAFWNANGQAGPTQMGGGSGTWSVTSLKWTDSVGSITGPMTPQPGFAIFGGAAGAVTVDNSDGAVSATGLQFASDGYTLTGDTLTLVGSNGVAPVIHVGNGSAAGAAWTATIGNVIAGSDGIDKTDLGTLVLTGSNTYTGATTIDAGTLALQGAGSIAGSSGVIANGTFDISGTNAGASIPTLSGSGQVALGSRTLTLTQAADTFAGAISGSGGLVISGNESLTGNSSYSGGTQLMSGSLTLGSASAIGSGTLAMANGTSIAFSDSFTLANAITLSGDPTVNVAAGLTTELGGTKSRRAR